MPEKVAITVLDANESPIKGALIALDGAHGTTDGNGQLKLSVMTSTVHFLTVSHPFYVTEEARFDGYLKTAAWNNSLVQRKSGSASDEVLLVVRIGRLAVAPTVIKTEAEIKTLIEDSRNEKLQKAENPRKVISTLYGNKRAYHGHTNETLDLSIAASHLLRDQPPAADELGWARLNTQPSVKINPLDTGRFFWLLHPESSHGEQFAIAVWSPNLAQANTPVAALDAVVYFLPDTSVFSAPYPMGISFEFEGQAYIDAGREFLIHPYCFATSLAAQGRQAAVIMPINKSTDFGPYSTREGVLRLIREVNLFLHRECRTSNLGLSPVGGITELEAWNGASLRSPGPTFSAVDFGLPPQPGRIAMAAFSGAVAALNSLLHPKTKLPSRFDNDKWGCPPSAVEALQSAWREIWDLDSRPEEIAGWETYLGLLFQWYRRDETRIFRLCHSSGAHAPNPKTHKHPLWKYLLAEQPIVDRKLDASKVTKIGGARELQGKRWSVVAFDDNFIGHKPEVGTPPLNDAHHATPKVAFSHYVTLSSIGK